MCVKNKDGLGSGEKLLPYELARPLLRILTNFDFLIALYSMKKKQFNLDWF